MKIVKESSTEIIFRETPNLFITIFMLIWSSGFIGIPLFMASSIFSNFGEVEFSCDRLEPQLVNCQSKKTPLFKKESTVIQKYNSVIAAQYKVDESRDSDGDRLTDHYITLITKNNEEFPVFQGSIYVNRVRGDAETVQAYASTLNQFLQSQQKSLVLTERSVLDASSILPLILISSFILIGVSALHFTVKTVTLTLNKNHNRITTSTLSVLGLWRSSAHLNQIEKVDVEEYKDSDGDLHFMTVIAMQSGQKYKFGGTTDRNTAMADANHIRNFLGFRVE